MKKLTRFDAMFAVINFGKKEERALLAEGNADAAYQIEHARNTLMYFLNDNAVKSVSAKIGKMVEYTVRADGVWEYDAASFVSDELTRELLKDLRKVFDR